MSEQPPPAATADDVDALIQELYGDLRLGTGVLHPSSVWRPDSAADLQLTLRIGSETPTCWHDTFALNLCRARADAILTSGRILRLEPDLSHDLQGGGDLPRALGAWRRRAGKARPPLTLVLTRSGDLDFEHPLWRGAGRRVIYTTRTGAFRVESRAADAGAEVEAVGEPTPESAISFLRAAFGFASISIEAGPSVARQLYQPSLHVDELLLSTFAGDHLPTSARGGRQPPRSMIEKLFHRPAPPFTVDTEHGRWRLERFLKR